MKKALISTIEPRSHFDSSHGYRVAQVENEADIFPVSEPDMYWLDCNDNVEADHFYFDTTENIIKETPKPTVELQPKTSGLNPV